MKDLLIFIKRIFDCHYFDMIDVPGHIQMQGYDQMQYINTLYPWDGHEKLRPPHISSDDNLQEVTLLIVRMKTLRINNSFWF